MEIWRGISEHEGYEVSDQGRVRNARTGHVLSPGRTGYKGKYLAVALGSKAPNKYIHHLVLTAFVCPRPQGLECRHRNDVGHDNRLENLHWGTSSQNGYDTVRNGHHAMRNRTHCKRGHRLMEPNLVDGLLRRGTRQCKACNRTYGYIRLHPELDFKGVSDRYYAALMPAEPKVLISWA